MDFKENLKAIRTDRGITQKSLGESLGVTPVTIGNWERGVRQPSLELLIQLASTLRTSTDELLGRPAFDTDSDMGQAIDSLVRKYKILDEHGKKLVDTICTMEYERVNHSAKVVNFPAGGRYIPRYMSPPAAGFGAPLEGDDFEMIRVDDNVPAEADYAIYISGDSMEPYIHDGEMVFVKEVTDLDEGDVGIFSVNGEMYCKQYYLDEERNLHLLSTNPKRADASIHVLHDGGYTVRCCGKVLLGFDVPLSDDI